MIRIARLLPLLLAAVLAACSLASSAQPSVTLTWTAPTMYTDGTPIPATQAITYIINQGPSGQEAKFAEGVSGTTWTSTSGLSPGTKMCWTVIAVDAQQGTQSVPTNEVCKDFAPLTPNPPGNLKAQ